MPSPIVNSGAGMSPKVLIGGKPVLLAGVDGVTSGVPPSPLIVAFPGQTTVMG